MSTALLKKSLELVDTEFVHKYTVKSKEKKKQLYSELKFKNRVKKKKDKRSVADVKQGNLNSVEKVRKQLKRKDIKESNDRKLKLLRKPVNKKIVHKILEHLGYGDKTNKKTEEQKTVFTEEDFLKFEKDYIDTD